MKRPTGRVPTVEELRLWETVTQHDARLTSAHHVPPATAAPVSRPGRSLPALPIYSLPKDAPPLTGGLYAGIDRATAERFRKGRLPIEGTLDLHGMHREQAHAALQDFIHGHAARQSRCLLVITGKGLRAGQEPGRTLLRDLVPQWLAESGVRPYILAFDTAQLKHGGAGAYYILLRRKRA